MIPQSDWIYDLETYPNIFTAAFIHSYSGSRRLFEISTRKNDVDELFTFLKWMSISNQRMVGFNNIAFDYPILHYLIDNYHYNLTVSTLYKKSQDLINASKDTAFMNIIRAKDRYIEQIDLYKIHHFDNSARRTSLKVLEFNMRSDSIQDLPFKPGKILTNSEMNDLIKYNFHDVNQTEKFYKFSLDNIRFRESLTKKHRRDFMNHSDARIGKDYFIMELEKRLPGSCYRTLNGNRIIRQTPRNEINLNDVIFPYIKFSNPEFNRILDYFKSKTINQTKGVFNKLIATVNGFDFVFGAGGIHGSIDSTCVESDDQYIIYDWDVVSFYPNIAIKNKLYPEHLSPDFVSVYQDIFNERQKYKKGTPENAMLKLANNAVYGDSNSVYSPFYDPKYTMSITINGQLLLCMLSEKLMTLPGISMIQANTDGVTVKCHVDQIDNMIATCKHWEQITQLELERAIYKRMFIKDVNNYLCEYENGEFKRKGAYEYELSWHQNFSSLVIQKAAEANLINNVPLDVFIRNHNDIHDFMYRTKVSRSSKLVINENGKDKELQNTTRYYISLSGGSLYKISPPAKNNKVGTWKRRSKLTDEYYKACLLENETIDSTYPIDANSIKWDERIHTRNQSKYANRREAINAGCSVTIANHIDNASFKNIDYEHYINEAKKLVDIFDA
jgi:hypothetical protein